MRGGSQQFSVILRHPTLYWASLAKEVMPYSTQTTNPQNHKESINVRIRGELYFFFFNPYVMFYDSVEILQ